MSDALPCVVSGGAVLLPDARLHDLQWLPVHRCGNRRGRGPLPVQLEEKCHGRRLRELRLMRLLERATSYMLGAIT